MPTSDLTKVDCIEWTDGPACYGSVEYHSIDPGRHRAYPRCEAHWEQRLERRENSIEKYEECDVPPGWFEPTYCGEEW